MPLLYQTKMECEWKKIVKKILPTQLYEQWWQYTLWLCYRFVQLGNCFIKLQFRSRYAFGAFSFVSKKYIVLCTNLIRFPDFMHSLLWIYWIPAEEWNIDLQVWKPNLLILWFRLPQFRVSITQNLTTAFPRMFLWKKLTLWEESL